MVKKSCSLILSAIVAIGILSGCEINVNEIVSNSSQSENSSTAFYESSVSPEENTDTDVDVPDTDTQTDSEEPEVSQLSFDTSEYQTMYVSGSATVSVVEDAKGNGSIIGMLSYGDSVSLIKNVVADRNDTENSMSFIYSETLGNFGYIKSSNLVEFFDEISSGQVYYVNMDNSDFYVDQSGSAVLATLKKNDMVTVIAKMSSGYWRASDKMGEIGYISSGLLSEEKIEKKNNSSKTSKNSSSKESSSKTESKAESKVESPVQSEVQSQTESRIEISADSTDIEETPSKTESENEPTVYTGVGDPPTSGYTLYIVDVDIDYLALRSKASSNPDSIIGELYYGTYVDVIDTSGDYWYIYAPSLGMYGFVSGNSDYLVYADY